MTYAEKIAELEKELIVFKSLLDSSNEIVKQLTERNMELEAQNRELIKKLEDAERALRIESNEPEERTQEASHYNWLEDKQIDLESKLAERTEENTRLKAELDHYKKNNTQFVTMPKLPEYDLTENVGR